MEKKISVKESMRFIDRLTDFLGTSEGQTKEEVNAALQEQRIDIDNMLIRTKEMINQAISAKKMQRLQDAPREEELKCITKEK